MTRVTDNLLDAQPVELTDDERVELETLFETTQDIDASALSTVPPATPRRTGIGALFMAALITFAREVREAVCWVCTGLGRRLTRVRAYLATYRHQGRHRVRRSVLHLGRDLSTAELVQRHRAARETDQEGDLPEDDFVTWVRLYLERQRQVNEILHPLAGSPRHLTC